MQVWQLKPVGLSAITKVPIKRENMTYRDALVTVCHTSDMKIVSGPQNVC